MTRRPTLARILPLAALATTLAACQGNAKPGEAKLPPAAGEGAAPRAPLPALTDEEAEKAAPAVASETTGTTFPQARAEVGPPLSGVIAAIAVEEGDKVKKGQVLFRLRTTDLSLHVQQARAAAAAAEVQLASAQTEFDRMQRLFDKKALEQAQLDRAKAQLEAARAGADAAKVGVSMARQVMGDSAVKSPIDGVVTAKLKNAGEMATMMPPTVVVVVEDHSTLELRFRLPEGRLGEIAAGDTLKTSFTSVRTQRDARVLRIAPSVDPGTRTVEVVATIDNADGALKAGMLANVDLPAGAAPEPMPEAKQAPAREAKTSPATPAAPAAPLGSPAAPRPAAEAAKTVQP